VRLDVVLAFGQPAQADCAGCRVSTAGVLYVHLDSAIL